MINYMLGIDGGGTKTAVTVLGEDKQILHTFNTGAININGESEENVRKNIFEIINKSTSYFDEAAICQSICVGAAGISNIKAKQLIEETIKLTGYSGKLKITGDHETALFGAIGKPVGIILIAGTGSIAFGKNSLGEEHRTGGFGYLIDDEGSGYAIGRDILTVVVRAFDGREEETILTELVFEKLSVSSIGEIIKFLYNKDTNKRDVAALAPILANACQRGDKAAIRIANKCSTELLKLIVPVVEKLNLYDCDLAMAGSILQKVDNIRDEFISNVMSRFPNINCIFPKNDASYGAALMAHMEYLK